LNFKKYTLKSQEALQTSQDIASNYGNQMIEPVHIFAAMIQDKNGIVPDILQNIGADQASLMINVNAILEKLPKVTGDAAAGHYFSKASTDAFGIAEKESKALLDDFVSIEHLLIGVAEVKSEITVLLVDNNINKKSILNVLKKVRGSQKADSQNPEDKYQALKRYGRMLNEEALKGKLDPVIGRGDEIRRVLQVLSRRTKNNPILIGDPGVGKTAIVEGLAQRIVDGDVPDMLKTKSVVTLDLGALLAGTSFRGQFEDRLKAIIKEVSESDGEIILFIDEIHTLIGAGATSGAMDAANILKPALARGELRCVGATTLDEYQKHFEKDAALERRFQKVYVDQPGIEDTISILRGLKEKYEVHHGVRITDAAIVAASELSDRYITDRFLPDKAIDLIDEAASKLRLEIDSMPQELDTIERKIRQLEIEKQALLREIKD
jgi:ATP-dependent Clp protease ATP-binding subunit ClpB